MAELAYREFLAAKAQLSAPSGLKIDPTEVHPVLKPHQRDAVVWAVGGGRRAIFAAFGLGKTLMQLEAVRLVLAKLGRGRGLIVLPLGVRQEFVRDAQLLDLEVTFIRRAAEASADGIYLTNYETVRDAKLDPRGFAAVSLDEAAILRGFGGTKTFRELMRLYEGSASYRFVATATPSPNEYVELLSYAAFLDVMDVGQAKTRFFKRDSAHADRLTLLPHMEEAFWHWVASWALFLQKPSDLGYSDEGYDLPPLDVRWHEVAAAAPAEAPEEWPGQTRLFRDASLGVSQAAREKRESLAARVATVMRIIGDARESSRTRARRPSAEDRAVQGVPVRVPTGVLPQDAGTQAAADAGGCAPSDLRTDRGGLRGAAGTPGGAVRNLHEVPGGPDGGSRPREREGARTALSQVQHGDRPAGGQPGAADDGGGVRDQFVVWCDLNGEQRALERALAAEGITYSSLYGSQSIEEREGLLDAWRRRETSVFLSKPSMYGAGVNLQQCNRMVFAGITYKFNEVIQAIHRIHRFLQDQPVRIDLIYTEGEREIRRQLERKWQQHDELVARMGEIIRRFGLSHEALAGGIRRTVGVERMEARGEGYHLVNADAVEETAAMPADSVDLVVTSIPFATQYEYTPSFNDFGHTEDNAHFWRQMDYLTPELLRVLRPGRVAAVHVKDRIAPGGLTGLGFQTVQPFHAEAIFHYIRHGFACLGMKTIVTDVVRENNQTYRLGWTEQCKDGSRMGVGMPEYVLLFRRPPTDGSNGYADTPVVKSKEAYSRTRWQVDAHGFARSSGNRPLMPEDLVDLPHERIFKLFRAHGLDHLYDFEEHVRLGEALEEKGRLPTTFMLLQPPSWHPDVWTDVARMRTLNMNQERRGREMHLCPLQFDIVDRLIMQLSMPGETVYDPFAGLMTVPYCAVKLGRRGVGVELNPTYFRDGAAYVEAAAQQASVPTLFDLLEGDAPPD